LKLKSSYSKTKSKTPKTIIKEELEDEHKEASSLEEELNPLE
jgi:hypothetical protein